ncbi:SpoVR family protein, partial [Vibrio parahaemolyticus]|nr:SpoVR family protein [Vibrio parahaemolyticus]
MMDAYSSIGMPINYNHWSFGKKFIQTEQNYKHGQMGLAYEIVINSDPCIAYLMEENTVTMQALVIAHACYGHNSFFKGNYLFQTWTDASSIIDYLLFAKKY